MQASAAEPLPQSAQRGENGLETPRSSAVISYLISGQCPLGDGERGSGVVEGFPMSGGIGRGVLSKARSPARGRGDGVEMVASRDFTLGKSGVLCESVLSGGYMAVT